MTQEEALNILMSGASVFLTGEPGSGKSYVAGRYIRALRAEGVPVSITASTGIAAAQMGGMTIHSWSGIGMRQRLAKSDLDAIGKNGRVVKRIQKTRVLVIDEVSMLSSTALTAVDAVCRHFRRTPAPFGGLQVVLVGDFFQLPPVIRREESELALGDRASVFAYASSAWRDLDPKVCYLLEQHRQLDEEFLELLGAIRSNACESCHFEVLAGRKLPESQSPSEVTRLFTHNVDVDRINLAELAKLPGETKRFFMQAEGDKTLTEGLKRGCLSPESLELKKGAVVMFTKNDPDGRFVNGTLGRVLDFDAEDGTPIVLTRSGARIWARRAEWKLTEDEAALKASISQIPLRLAWAITVHKSQGMSLDAAVIDLSGAFEYGQGYVALSRVRSLKGLYLLGWNAKALRVHPEALEKDTAFRIASEREVARLEGERCAPVAELRPRLAKERPELPAPGKAPVPLPASAGRPWSAAEDAELSLRFRNGDSTKAMAEAHGRTAGAVRSRLRKLGLIAGPGE